MQRFQDKFFELDWQELYGTDTTASNRSDASPFGTFAADGADRAIELTSDGLTAECPEATWAGVPFHLRLRSGEVAAFAIEVVEGLVRIGWAAPGVTLS